MKGKVITGLKFFLKTKWKESEMPGRMHVIKMWSKTEGMEPDSCVCVWNIEMDDSAHKLGMEFDSTKAKLGLGASL